MIFADGSHCHNLNCRACKVLCSFRPKLWPTQCDVDCAFAQACRCFTRRALLVMAQPGSPFWQRACSAASSGAIAVPASDEKQASIDQGMAALEVFVSKLSPMTSVLPAVPAAQTSAFLDPVHTFEILTELLQGGKRLDVTEQYLLSQAAAFAPSSTALDAWCVCVFLLLLLLLLPTALISETLWNVGSLQSVPVQCQRFAELCESLCISAILTSMLSRHTTHNTLGVAGSNGNTRQWHLLGNMLLPCANMCRTLPMWPTW